MKLKEGCKEEYRKRHDEIWPELAEQIKKGGVGDYSIFLDEETYILFAVQKVEGGIGSQDMGDDALTQKWWRYMSDIMDTNEDYSPVSIPLEEVFYMK